MPKIVVEHRKELSYLLCQAAEIEHMAMCQYLYAAFSLKTAPGPGLGADQVEMVERWRSEILKIAGEEMLHWALVNNLLTAIGSAPFVSRPNLPHRAKGYPPSVQFALLPFGEAALRHFVYFERPQDADVAEVEQFSPVGNRPAPMTATELQPRGQDYVSQGDLYRALDDGLEYLAAKLGEDGLFIGPERAQATQASFGWPELIAVTDLASAKLALTRIIEQGEGGSSRDVTTAHYGRFVTILDEYLTARAADPSFEPAHPVTAATVRTVEDEEPSGPVITDPVTSAVSDLFNVVNDLVLHILSRFFAFGDESPRQQAVLTDAAVGLMFGAVKPLGLLLASLPVGGEHPGQTAGANFQLAYRANFLLPHQQVAWIRYAERLEEAADFADGVDAGGPTGAALSPISAFMRRTAATFWTHLDAATATDAAAAGQRGDAGPAAISVQAGGPYVVRGGLPIRRMRPLRSAAGEPLAWEVTEHLESGDLVKLCRCGGSASKPFCDNTHETREWDASEAAPTSTYAERAHRVEGDVVEVHDDRSICSRAGLCATRLSNVWKAVKHLDREDAQGQAYVMAVVERCPSGALTLGAPPDGGDVEPRLAPAIGVTDHGPLFVSGRVPVERADGQPLETRNRMVLCRCGESAIKPLCDGSHTTARFRDPARPDRDRGA